MERMDNLTVKVIDNKAEYIKNLVTDKKELGEVLSIDLIKLDIDYLSRYSVENVLLQAGDTSNRYLWVEKFHE